MVFKIKPVWIIAVCFVALMRVYFYFATPVIDNDSIVVIMGARNLVETGAISKINTLPTLISGLLYYIFGESILLARLAQVLAGIGCMALLLWAGKKVGKTSGPVAAIIFGALPLTILYASIAKSYSLMTFLILAAAMVFGHAVEKSCTICSVIPGILFALAFLCYTFAASALFPIIILFALSIFFKKWRVFFKPALISGMTFGLALLGIVAWRWKEFGWSIFNDYVTDWRFDAATDIWSGRYIGLMDIWGVGIAILIPGIIILANKFEIFKKLGPFGIYGLIFCVINFVLWLLNPVNHFPRVLLPSLPFIAFFVAVAIEKVAEEKDQLGTFIAWIVTTISMLVFLYPRFQHGNQPLWFFTPQTLKGISLTVLAIAVTFIFLTIIFMPLRKIRLNQSWVLPGAISILAFVLGPIMTYQIIIAQSRVFQSRAALVRHAGVMNLMGGGDYQLLAGVNLNYTAWLVDLPAEELDMVIDGKILEVCRARGISHIIVSRDDPDGVLEMLAGIALRKGKKITSVGSIFRPLDDIKRVFRVGENEYGALYKIVDIESQKWSTKQKDRLHYYHCPFEIRHPDMGIYLAENDCLAVKISSGNTEARISYSVKMISEDKVETITEGVAKGENFILPLSKLSKSDPLYLEKYAGKQVLFKISDTIGNSRTASMICPYPELNNPAIKGEL